MVRPVAHLCFPQRVSPRGSLADVDAETVAVHLGKDAVGTLERAQS